MTKTKETILEFTGTVKRKVDGGVFNKGDEVQIEKVEGNGRYGYKVSTGESNTPTKHYHYLEELLIDIDPNYYGDSEQVYGLGIHQSLNEANIATILKAVENDELEQPGMKKLVVQYLKKLQEKAPIIEEIVRDYEIQRREQRKKWKGY